MKVTERDPAKFKPSSFVHTSMSIAAHPLSMYRWRAINYQAHQTIIDYSNNNLNSRDSYDRLDSSETVTRSCQTLQSTPEYSRSTQALWS
eukprot:scaffold4459_cov117-Skeletonema_dohrnii-CCMP3373.AAC.3